jgi:arylsulfatase B
MTHINRMCLIVLAALCLVVPRPALAVSNNILLIVTDDQGVDNAGFLRTSVRKATSPATPAMPELLALANQGVTFTKAWTTPWCSPTRATIITGRYGFRYNMGVPIDQSVPTVELPLSEVTLPEIVRTSSRNYMTRHIGKFHLREDLDGPRDLHWENAVGTHPGAGGPASGTGTGSPNYNSWRKYTNGTRAGSDNTTYVLTDQVNEAIDTIDAADTANRPYFIWLGTSSIHSPWDEPPSGLYTGTLPGSPTNRQVFEKMIMALDTEIGRLLDNVDLATTTVIFIGDNGSPNPGDVVASPYDQDKAKGSPYNNGMHVPFVIAGQAVTARGYNTALVNSVDLFPTIIELAGLSPATVSLLSGVKIDGVTLTPYLTGTPHPNPRDWIYAEEFKTGWNEATADRARTMRNHVFQLIEWGDGTREFYNLVNDPLNATNILSRTRTTTEAANLTALDAQLDALIATR